MCGGYACSAEGHLLSACCMPRPTPGTVTDRGARPTWPHPNNRHPFLSRGKHLTGASMEDLGHSFAGIKEFKNGPGGGGGRGLGRGQSSEEPWGPSGLGVRAGLRMGLLQVMGTGCLPEGWKIIFRRSTLPLKPCSTADLSSCEGPRARWAQGHTKHPSCLHDELRRTPCMCRGAWLGALVLSFLQTLGATRGQAGSGGSRAERSRAARCLRHGVWRWHWKVN